MTADAPTHALGRWPLIVVGGGHAGCEAALAGARSGIPTLLLTQSVDRIGWMSCNPAIGGVGKSHLVAEIDALGGEMARNTDRAGVHYKLLNASRGPAVRAMRVQCDKLAYATALRQVLEAQADLAIKQATVTRLWLDEGRLRGVQTGHGIRFEADAVILTAGTFLTAICHTGDSRERGGRAGEGSDNDLGAQLRDLGVATGRHKTGTCPRLDARTINWSALAIDAGLKAPPPMARRGDPVQLPQMDCHVAHTNRRTHDIIRAALPRSPLFSGAIDGTGPRYCPSIEDKVVRFADRDSHQLFLEREGWQTSEVYLSGLSTSLPADAQIDLVHSIEGLEEAEIVRFGYAVEYDTIDPRQLDRGLQLRALPGLFLAGQVNGTSGYEEAAAQGLVAALGAVALLRQQEPPRIERTDAYIGVLIDDLITRGGDEPYRMFTSRAEHRLSLRIGSADRRLTPLGRRLGLVTDADWSAFEARQRRLDAARNLLDKTMLHPTAELQARILALGDGGLRTPTSLAGLLRRPKVAWADIADLLPEGLRQGGDPGPLSEAESDELITESRYQGYIEREKQRLERTRKAGSVRLPDDLDYSAVGGLSAEAVEKLQRVRPDTLGQAGRIPGLTAGALQALAVHIELRRRRRV